jgi:hypothetical protein
LFMVIVKVGGAEIKSGQNGTEEARPVTPR